MVLILPNSAMVHCRKTGGTYAKHIIAALGIPTTEERIGTKRSGKHQWNFLNAHDTYDEARHLIEDKPVFGFVRHPLSLLKSYWAFRTIHGWVRDFAIDAIEPKHDLSEWLTKVAASHPGHVGNEYRRYYTGCLRLARTEDMAVALIQILREYEPGLDEHLVREVVEKTPKINVTNSETMYVHPDVVQLVISSEVEAIKIWETLTL